MHKKSRQSGRQGSYDVSTSFPALTADTTPQQSYLDERGELERVYTRHLAELEYEEQAATRFRFIGAAALITSLGASLVFREYNMGQNPTTQSFVFWACVAEATTTVFSFANALVHRDNARRLIRERGNVLPIPIAKQILPPQTPNNLSAYGPHRNLTPQEVLNMANILKTGAALDPEHLTSTILTDILQPSNIPGAFRNCIQEAASCLPLEETNIFGVTRVRASIEGNLPGTTLGVVLDFSCKDPKEAQRGSSHQTLTPSYVGVRLAEIKAEKETGRTFYFGVRYDQSGDIYIGGGDAGITYRCGDPIAPENFDTLALCAETLSATGLEMVNEARMLSI